MVAGSGAATSTERERDPSHYWLDALAEHPLPLFDLETSRNAPDLFQSASESIGSGEVSFSADISAIARVSSQTPNSSFDLSLRYDNPAEDENLGDTSIITQSASPSRVKSVLRTPRGTNRHRPQRTYPPATTVSNRLIVLRDGKELIVALNPTKLQQGTTPQKGRQLPVPCLRVLNLKEWKRACSRAIKEDLEDPVGKAIEQANYKELRTPGIDFVVRQLELNATGKLLAVVGDHDVAVVAVPSMPLRSDKKVVECRTLLIGEMHHSADSYNRIVKVMWHPLSDGNLHLMIMSSDGCLRMYNVATNPDDPEQTFYFGDKPLTEDVDAPIDDADMDEDLARTLATKVSLVQRRKTGVFTASYEEHEAVSFCLGADGDGMGGLQDSSGWGPFTVYGLMRSGDLYAMCPVIPNQSKYPRAKLNALKALNTASWKLSDSSDAVLQKQYYWRQRWIDEILNQHIQQRKFRSNAEQREEEGQDEPDQENDDFRLPQEVVISPPLALSKLRIARQGPFLMQPPPTDASMESNACDISLVGVGGGSGSGTSRGGRKTFDEEGDGAEDQDLGNILLVAFESGKVLVGLELDPVEPTWEFTAGGDADSAIVDESEPPRTGGVGGVRRSSSSASSARSPSLSVPGGNPVTIVKDPKYPDTVYVYHHSGVHRICLGDWVEALIGLARQEEGEGAVEEEKVSKLLSGESVKADVRWMVCTRPVKSSELAPILGFAVISDLFLGYSYILLTTSYGLYGEPLPIRFKPIAPPTSTTSAIEAKKTQEKPPPKTIAGQPWQTLQTPFEEPEMLRAAGTGPPRIPRILPPASSKGVGYPAFLNEETLQFVSDRMDALRNELVMVYNAGLSVDERFQRQQLDLTTHIKIIQRIQSHLSSTLYPSMSSLSSRLSSCLRTHRKLALQADMLLQILQDATAPAITDAEKRWFEELKGAKREVPMFAGEIDKLKNQHKILERQTQNKVDANTRTSTTMVTAAATQPTVSTTSTPISSINPPQRTPRSGPKITSSVSSRSSPGARLFSTPTVPAKRGTAVVGSAARGVEVGKNTEEGGTSGVRAGTGVAYAYPGSAQTSKVTEALKQEYKLLVEATKKMERLQLIVEDQLINPV
ncbi:hypothetical protein HK102_001353 [Quaeritorhiza haematococci]|nr:hypothetical protein HK102_001353 [Quaeritorhiza haematococci]